MASTSTQRSSISRRVLLQAGIAASGLTLLHASRGNSQTTAFIDLPFERGRRPLAAFPQKRPLMVMTTRPPQLETPFPLFDQHLFTPNDAFFVRWHLANIPSPPDLASFKLHIHGHVRTPISWSVDALQRDFEPVEIAAVCQCAGNSRGLFEPRVPGGQWGHGAMGNAQWTGVRLRDLLNAAGVKAGAVDVRFNGADTPVADATPDFRKSLAIDEARQEEVLVAYAMNGEPLPWLNGFPLRLVVPGRYATYWVKMLNDIDVLNEADRTFWTRTAYRLPADPCRCVEPGTQPKRTVPIQTMTVRSFITNMEAGHTVEPNTPITVRGIAFDQGYGIDRVLFSADGGRHWQRTTLGADHGNYSFRPWEVRWTPAPGQHALQSLAINRIGETQRLSARWNPSGYLRNAVETVHITAT